MFITVSTIKANIYFRAENLMPSNASEALIFGLG